MTKPNTLLLYLLIKARVRSSFIIILRQKQLWIPINNIQWVSCHFLFVKFALHCYPAWLFSVLCKWFWIKTYWLESRWRWNRVIRVETKCTIDVIGQWQYLLPSVKVNMPDFENGPDEKLFANGHDWAGKTTRWLLLIRADLTVLPSWLWEWLGVGLTCWLACCLPVMLCTQINPTSLALTGMTDRKPWPEDTHYIRAS